MLCENTLEASSRSLENVYDALIVRPCDSRSSSLAAMALYVEFPTLSRNSASVVNLGYGRNSCCSAMAGPPRDDEAGTRPKYGLGTRASTSAPAASECGGGWTR